MITFHNSHLAPPKLCQLLYQVVDDDDHLPVVFHSVRDSDRRGILGTHDGDRIDIHLDQIYRELRGKHLAAPSSYLSSTALEVNRLPSWTKTVGVFENIDIYRGYEHENTMRDNEACR